MEKIIQQIVRKQHYIPQFYLKKWVGSDNGFYPIKIERKEPPILNIFDKKSNPSRFCYENFFYAQHTGEEDEISQSIEKDFADIEGVFASKLLEIEEKILNNQQITSEDKFQLSEFMIFIWLKGKLYRGQSQKMTEIVIKDINKFLVQDIDKNIDINQKMKKLGLTKQDMIDFAEKGEYSVDVGNMHHLSIIKDMYGFCNLLSAKYWKIYISKKGEFITTDAPYLDMPLSKNFWGNDFFSREQSFILSPKIFIVALNPVSESGKTIVRKDITQDIAKIQQINCHNLMNSIKFGFHENKKLLEDLKKLIIFIYENKNLLHKNP